MYQPNPLISMIEEAVELAADKTFRAHLGGSMIGKPCDREIWYGFRHAKAPQFKGRMYRLFNRGHLEESRFTGYLRSIGVTVREYSESLWYHNDADDYIAVDWDAVTLDMMAECFDVTADPMHLARAKLKGVELKQWRILDVDGHFGGSLDGILLNVPGFSTTEQILAEFKTHNEKSFTKLKDEGVKVSKPTHYRQMQVYMHKRKIYIALYMAVNKNTDELYIEFVHYDQAEAEAMLARAVTIIYSAKPPKRIAQRPSWFDCKFCDFAGICHYGEPMVKSCRNCRFSAPGPNGSWFCGRWQGTIPPEAIAKGCDAYLPITD